MSSRVAVPPNAEIIPGPGLFGAAAETGTVINPGRPVAADYAVIASRTTPIFPAEGALTKLVKYDIVHSSLLINIQ